MLYNTDSVPSSWWRGEIREARVRRTKLIITVCSFLQAHFFKHIIESDGEYLFVLQFSVTNEGMVLREKEVAGASIAPPQ